MPTLLESESGEAGLFRTVAERTAVADLLLLLSVPVTLLAVASLPLGVRESFVFQYAAPTFRTALVSPFVHLGPAHLAVNLLAYTLVTPVAYLLSVAAGHRRRFRISFVSLVLACPILLSYLNLAIVRSGGSVGFSGVLMALYGYLPLAIAGHAERELDLGVERTTAPLLFFIGVALITVLTLGAVLNHSVTVPVWNGSVDVTGVIIATLIGLLAALALVLVWYVMTVTDGQRSARAAVSAAMQEQGHFELGVLATVLFLALPFATFPVDPVLNGRVLNLYVHLLGYALGFIATYVVFVVEPVGLSTA